MHHHSHPDPAVRQQRFHAACHAAANLMRSGHIVFSPIAHGHSICLHGLPTDWRFWDEFDRAFLVRSDELLVLTLDGWRESQGVAAEIRIAGELGKPVSYLAADSTGSPTSEPGNGARTHDEALT